MPNWLTRLGAPGREPVGAAVLSAPTEVAEGITVTTVAAGDGWEVVADVAPGPPASLPDEPPPEVCWPMTTPAEPAAAAVTMHVPASTAPSRLVASSVRLANPHSPSLLTGTSSQDRPAGTWRTSQEDAEGSSWTTPGASTSWTTAGGRMPPVLSAFGTPDEALLPVARKKLTKAAAAPTRNASPKPASTPLLPMEDARSRPMRSPSAQAMPPSSTAATAAMM